MRREVLIIVICGILFAVVVFVGITIGLGYTGAAAVSATIGSLAGLAVFLGMMISLERFIDQVEITRHTSQIDDLLKERRDKGRRKTRKEIDDLYSTPTSVFERLGSSLRRIFAPGNKISALRIRMLSAGYARENAILAYFVIKAAMPLIGMALSAAGAVLFYTTNPSDILLAMAMGSVGAYLSVDLLLDRRIKGRRAQIKRELPDVLDLLVIYTESGVSFDSALQRTCIALEKRAPAAISELALLERELRVLPERLRAYDNLNKRAELAIIKNFCAILVQSERIGSPISRSLRQLGNEARRERMIEAEKKAAKIPILMQLPILLFILPSLLLLVLGPTAIQLGDSLGQLGNKPPVAVNDEARTVAGQAVSVRVLANDRDPNPKDQLSVLSVETPAYGTARLNQDGTVSYTPREGFVGTDRFFYTVRDRFKASRRASVTVEVTGTPAAGQ